MLIPLLDSDWMFSVLTSGLDVYEMDEAAACVEGVANFSKNSKDIEIR